ncbi:hypothetical protein GNT69_24730 [Bacillus sp. B15-48]|nr:hypothetical protein [Bacillus sp. B15-48]
MHWPSKVRNQELLVTWKTLEKLYKHGVVRAIEVPKFHIHHLKTLIEDSEKTKKSPPVKECVTSSGG